MTTDGYGDVKGAIEASGEQCTGFCSVAKAVSWELSEEVGSGKREIVADPHATKSLSAAYSAG